MALTTLAAVAAAVAFPGLAAATKSPAGVISVPLSRDDGLTAYYAKLQVGTPPQTEYLKIDTGSPRYSFLDPRNEVCKKQGNNCKTFGTFSNKTSKYVPRTLGFLSLTNVVEHPATKVLASPTPWATLVEAII